eukprot:9589294-Ditylum_brightwellii.AAC.1
MWLEGGKIVCKVGNGDGSTRVSGQVAGVFVRRKGTATGMLKVLLRTQQSHLGRWHVVCGCQQRDNVAS